jgi:protein dithiol oxidoreductase (disulfide-forming)
MKRREFATGLTATLAGLALPAAWAQAPKAGSDYVVLRQPLAGGTDGKV